MKRTAAYRICADICFYYLVLSLFSAMHRWQTPMALFAAASLAVSLAAVHCPWAALRLLLSLLPGLVFLNAQLRLPLVFPALAWLYLILMLTGGRFQLWLDDYRRVYRAMLAASLFLIAANVLAAAAYRGAVISEASLVYAMAFLCLGAFAMRGMQMNANMNLRWTIANAAVVIGVPLLAVVGSLSLYVLLRWLMVALKVLFGLIGQLIARLLNPLFRGAGEAALPTPTPLPTPSPTPGPSEEAPAFGDVPEDVINWRPDPGMAENAARIGGYVVLAILLLAAVYVIVRLVRRNRVEPETYEYDFEVEEDDAELPRRKAEKVSPGTYARQIRGVYRKYMELMRSRGVRIRKNNTSREILDEAEKLRSSPDAQRLRELYLKARYGEDEAVTRAELQEAARCLKMIRGEDWK